MLQSHSSFQVDDVVDPAEIQAARVRRSHFDRNSQWLQTNIADVYAAHRGRHICIAGQQVFAGDTAADAIALATAAHPEDLGWFTRYVPQERLPRLYAI